MNQTVEFHNRAAAFLWGFAVVFLGFAVALSWVLWRDGPPAGYAWPFTIGVGLVGWLTGGGFAAYACGKPCVRVTVESGVRVTVVWRYPLKTVVREAACSTLAAAQVVETRDGDGDPYFMVRWAWPGGTDVVVVEGRDRQRCEALCARLNAAVGQG